MYDPEKSLPLTWIEGWTPVFPATNAERVCAEIMLNPAQAPQ
jgi:hypothetical protein